MRTKHSETLLSVIAWLVLWQFLIDIILLQKEMNYLDMKGHLENTVCSVLALIVPEKMKTKKGPPEFRGQTRSGLCCVTEPNKSLIRAPSQSDLNAGCAIVSASRVQSGKAF